jgi:hypothetical protein
MMLEGFRQYASGLGYIHPSGMHARAPSVDEQLDAMSHPGGPSGAVPKGGPGGPPSGGKPGSGAAGGSVPQLTPGIRISEKQFGKKVGKHAEDFGLDPSNPTHRQQVRDRITEIGTNYSELRQGDWHGSTALFYRQGNDVVLTKPNGEFVTILKDGSSNLRFLRAKVLFP